MTARQARNARRAAERREAKLARKATSSHPSPDQIAPLAPSLASNPEPSPELSRARQQADPPARDRAAINRDNARHSTGPRTPEGKARSSRNSFKHGLYSTQLVLPGEDPAELDALRAALRSEHQPANTTEDILVNELAEHFWRLRRMRALEASALDPELFDRFFEDGTYALILRAMAAAERAFHKSLATLRQLQKDRGFVPQIAVATEEIDATSEELSALAPHSGFVPENPRHTQTASPEFVWQNAPHGANHSGDDDFFCSEAA